MVVETFDKFVKSTFVFVNTTADLSKWCSVIDVVICLFGLNAEI